MKCFFRMVLVATALLTSGAPQVVAALGDDACCADERGVPCPDCPPGLVCACCPMRGALSAAVPDMTPAAAHAVSVAVAAEEPVLLASASDIFQPPRA
jgi:hypothetical protein